MKRKYVVTLFLSFAVAAALYSNSGIGQQRAAPSPDAVQDAQSPKQVQPNRPEQQKSSHDQSDVFSGINAPLSSPALQTQPDSGKMEGFDFARDPLNSKRPLQPAEEIMKNDIAEKPKVRAIQQKLLEQRYDLKPRLDPDVKMSRGKPLPLGPAARLQGGLTWQSIAQLAPEELRKTSYFPLSLSSPSKACSGRHGFSASAD